jgi:hypothetical protein
MSMTRNNQEEKEVLLLAFLLTITEDKLNIKAPAVRRERKKRDFRRDLNVL